MQFSENFENDFMQRIEQEILAKAKDVAVLPPYSDRIKLDSEFLESVWKMIDVEALKVQMAKIIQEQLAERLCNAVASEIATDIKSVLSNKERRENIRYFVRKNIDELTQK